LLPEHLPQRECLLSRLDCADQVAGQVALYGKPLQQVGALVLAEGESERAGVLRRRFAVRSQTRCSQPGRWCEFDDGCPVVGVLGELGKSGEVLIGPAGAQRMENLRVQPPPVRVSDAG
jgi:hypothetical protein